MKVITILTLIMASFPAFANAGGEFIWDNTGKFESAARCKVERDTNTRFQIVSSTSRGKPYVEILEHNGRHYSYLLGNSIVKFVRAGESGKTRYMEVVGVTSNAKVNTRRGFLARLDRGYLRTTDLEDIGNYIVEIGSDAPVDQIATTGFSVKGSLWQAVKEGGSYVTYHCLDRGVDRQYLAFDVFEPNRSEPIVRVGVNWDDTNIFRSVRAFKTPADIKKAQDKTSENKNETVTNKTANVAAVAGSVANAATNATAAAAATASTAAQGPVEFVPVPRSRPDGAPQVQAQTQTESKSDATATASADEVVCSQGGSINVRDVRTGRVLFQADSMEAVSVLDHTASTRVIGGHRYTMAEVRFTGRARGRNLGLVAQDLLQTKQACEEAQSQNKPTEDAIDYVMCPPQGSVNVHARNLRTVLFTADKMESVKPVKPLTATGIKKTVDGQKYEFIEVEFPNRSSRRDSRGWVAKTFVEAKASCQSAVKAAAADDKTQQTKTEAKDSKPQSSDSRGLLAPNCAKETILKAAKTTVRRSFGNRSRSHGKCALGVRLSLQRSNVGDINGGMGNAVDFLSNLKQHGYVSTGITSVAAAPAGAVLIFGGPYTKQYFRNGHYGHPPGNWLGHVTIKGDDGYFYTDGRTRDPAIGWSNGRNRAHIRNLIGVYVPGEALVKKYAGRCKGL